MVVLMLDHQMAWVLTGRGQSAMMQRLWQCLHQHLSDEISLVLFCMFVYLCW